MEEKELEYYKSQVDLLAGELINKEYSVAQLSNESRQMQSGFKLLLSISSEFYKHSELNQLADFCCENTMSLLSLDGVVLLKKCENNTYSIFVCKGNYPNHSEENTKLNASKVKAWFGNQNSLLINGTAKADGAGSDICDWIGLPFCVAVSINIDSEEGYVLIGCRNLESMLLRQLPFSETDVYIFQTVTSLFADLAGKLQFDNRMEEERNRIARDMHDNLGSEITGISMITDQLMHESVLKDKTQLKKIKIGVCEIVEHLGNTIWLLNSGNNKLEDMVTYMRGYAGKIAEEQKINIHLNDAGIEAEVSISSEKRHHMFMVFKEALNNITKHAEATEICIEIIRKPGVLEMKIKDNGLGFEKERRFGNGLKNMRKRILDCQGIIEIHSKPGHGACIFISIPVS